MEEKRKHQRTEINEPAYVSSAGSVMGCVVRNISPDGAAMNVGDPRVYRAVSSRDREELINPGVQGHLDPAKAHRPGVPRAASQSR